MEITADWLNSLSIEQRKEALRGDFGRKMHAWAASHVTMFWWVRTTVLGTLDVHNGTAFFLATQDQVFVVTAAHVYNGYVADLAKPRQSIQCCLGNVPFDPVGRLHAIDDALDIAVFRIGYDELRALRKQPIVIDPADWPPHHPASGQAAILVGFPGRSRIWERSDAISFGMYVAIAMLGTASDRQITCPFDRSVWGDLRGLPLPPEGFNLGGISGGPLLVPMCRPDGTWAMTLGGVIFEAPTDANSLEVVIAAPAHFIRSDGRLDPSSMPMQIVQLEKRRP